jgi:hypothetical protein
MVTTHAYTFIIYSSTWTYFDDSKCVLSSSLVIQTCIIHIYWSGWLAFKCTTWCVLFDRLMLNSSSPDQEEIKFLRPIWCSLELRTVVHQPSHKYCTTASRTVSCWETNAWNKSISSTGHVHRDISISPSFILNSVPLWEQSRVTIYAMCIVRIDSASCWSPIEHGDNKDRQVHGQRRVRSYSRTKQSIKATHTLSPDLLMKK